MVTLLLHNNAFERKDDSPLGDSIITIEDYVDYENKVVEVIAGINYLYVHFEKHVEDQKGSVIVLDLETGKGH